MKFHSKGISLLEVIAALVVLSMGATVAFGWFSQSANTINRLKQEEIYLLVHADVIEYVRTINPLLNLKGSSEIQNYKVTWSSTPIAPVQTVLNNRGGKGKYEVCLFDVDVDIQSLENEEQVYNFSLQLPGYKLIPSGTSEKLVW